MIELRDPKKRIWLKVIASFLVVTFVWYDIAWSADLFYTFGKPAVESVQNLPQPKETKVTNYDVLEYNKKQSAAQALLPTTRDREQTGSFAPGYIQEQQAKHEEIIGQKQAEEDLSWMLRNNLKREDEDIELKKKQSGAGGVSYTLEDPDQTEDAHTATTPTNDSWSETVKYNITKMNIDALMANATKKEDKNGVSYWLGHGGAADDIDPERLIMTVVYDGTGDNKLIKTIYTGYRNNAEGKYEAKYRIDYVYSGKDISVTKKYDVSGGTDKLVEKSVYEGTGDDNHIKTTVYYGEDGAVSKRRDFKYTDNILKETLYYETNSETEGEGELTQRTVFTGEKNKEIADYTKNYYTDKTTGTQYTTDTTVYYYANGKRANETSGEEYRYSKSKQVTFRGNPDTNSDGVLSDEELSSARKTSMLVYDDTNRLANEETADYMVIFSKSGTVTKTTVYLYKNGKRATDANYTECMESAVTYYGTLDKNNDGEIDAGELAAGVIESKTVYDTKSRLKGEEVQDYTLVFTADGKTVNETTVYVYEGEKRASEVDNEARMERSVTYWGEALNEDGTLKGDARKKSETLYQFSSSAKRGEEVADVTLSYYSDGKTVRDTTVYFYKGNKRAADSTVRDGLERSATYWGDALVAVDLLDGSGNYDMAKVAEFIKARLGIDLASAASAQEALDAFLEFISGGNAELKSVLEALLAMDPAELADKEKLVSSLLALTGANTELMEILLSIDMASVTSKEDLIAKLLAAAGLDEISAAVIAMILSVKITAGMTKEEYIDALALKISGTALTSLFMKAISKLTKKISEYTSIDGEGGIRTELLSYITDDELKALIESIDATGMTAQEFIDAVIAKLSTTAGAASLFMKAVSKLTKKISEYTSIDGEGGIRTELLSYITDDELKALIESIDATGMTAQEFIDAVIAKMGLTEAGEELLALLVSVDVNTVDTAEELMLLLIKARSGDKAAVKALINMLLGLDLESFESPEDLLNMLILLIGGPALTELKDKLTAMGTAIDTYPTAVGLLSALTDTSATLGGFIDNVKSLIADGTLADADVLSALKKLASGDGPAALVRLILAQVPDTAIRDALISVIAGDNAELLNLLAGIDMTGVTTTEDFVRALMAVDTDGDTYPDLIEIMLGTEADNPEDMPASLVYRYELRADARLKSETFYVIDIVGSQLPQSIANYTLNYAYDGRTIRETSVYYYEDPDGVTADVRASYTCVDPNNSIRDSRKTRVLTYRDDARTGEDGNVIRSGAVRKSETFYAFRPDTAVGSEVANYTYSYSYTGTAVRDISVYIYEGGNRATEPGATIKSRKEWVVTYITTATVADITGLVDPAEYDAEGAILPGKDGIKDDANKKTETKYFFDATTSAGDEISDYTYNYVLGTPNIKETTIYKYGAGDIRADAVTSQPNSDFITMSKSITYAGEAIIDASNDMIKSETFYYSKTNSMRGEEISLKTFTYNALHHLAQTTYYYYGDSYAEPDSAMLSDEPLTKSKTFNHENILTSESLYSGFKGEELVQKTYSYGYNAETMSTYAVSRTDYSYLDNTRIKQTRTYDINNRFGVITDPESTALLIQVTDYNYMTKDEFLSAIRAAAVSAGSSAELEALLAGVNLEGAQTEQDAKDLLLAAATAGSGLYTLIDGIDAAVNKYRLVNTVTKGTQYNKQVATQISGTYKTVSQYNDYDVMYSSVTTGVTNNLSQGTVSGAYTTTSVYDENFGILESQVTDGESYTYADANGDGEAEQLVVGKYATGSRHDVDSTISDGTGAFIKQVDEYGTIRESVTNGETGKYYDSAAGIFDIKTGAYTTTSLNNSYGTLYSQQTIGESYNKIADGTTGEDGKPNYVQFTVGSYTTNATVIDAFGTVLTSVTNGASQKLDLDGTTTIKTGSY
ncbi:MAG: hypothetical protein PHI58_03890, partial [Candidatus Omnitrophica bacterium]|nr:hypothetical protein [Candidatus Omnitrophota bacterium]